MDELREKRPTGEAVLGLSDYQLDETLLSCFIQRVDNAKGPIPGKRTFSRGELENIYSVGLSLPFARHQEVHRRISEAYTRLETGGYIMKENEYGGMTVTTKGRNGLPPQFDHDRFLSTLWILECEKSCKQGTAFTLEGVGLVTCKHVLGPDTRAFKAASPSEKFAVTVVASDPTLDLAILRIDGEIHASLRKGDVNTLQSGQDLTIAGFPNYRMGDSGTLITGKVAGFRMVSSIRRFLVSISIVAGGSGSPAVNSAGEVVGVAATGADRMETAPGTEHHSVIPINALHHLQRT